MTRKTVVVTGGNRGIGLGITEAFVDAGYAVVVGARSAAGVTERFGDAVRFVPMDVKAPAGHAALAAAAREWTGRLDAWVNNAGFSAWRPLAEIDEAFLEDILSTNLKGAFWGCQAAAAHMTGGGSIINISSIASKRGTANNAAYCASKFGMNGLTQALAKELGPRGIRVNALCPVLIATEGLVEALHGPYAPGGGDVEGFLRRFTAEQTALVRLPTAEEVGAMCVVLASDASSAVTAQCINVDCGVFPQ
jgi:3-oxoacyl-[acyl-carrier protein] reductase/meso-butanediol dehydrogenase/(S,S)-butanediol dehydrogenase/diacetyl reductase